MIDFPAAPILDQEFIDGNTTLWKFNGTMWRRQGVKKPGGQLVQSISTIDTGVSTGSTPFVIDDTIPQNTEGTELTAINTTITPTDATNLIRITVTCMMSVTAVGRFIGAMFVDSVADSLAALHVEGGNVNVPSCLHLEHVMVAGSVSAMTFKFRGGIPGAGTITFNGQSSARRFGGVGGAIMTVQEIKTP